MAVSAGAAIFLAGALRDPSSPYLLVGLTAAAVGLAIPAYLRGARDPLSPALAFAAIFFVYYVLRPLHVLSSGVLGPAKSSYDTPIAAVLPSVRMALLLAAFGVASFFLAYIAAIRKPSRSLTDERVEHAWLALEREHFHFAVVIASICAIAFIGTLVIKSGGLAAYLGQIGYRQHTFTNIAFLTQLALPIKSVLFVALLSRRAPRPQRASWRLILLLGALAATTDVFTGGRANLIIGTILPALLIVHYALRPLRAHTVIVAGLVLLAIAISFRVVFRDSQFSGSSDHSRTSLLQQAYRQPLDAVVGGHDTIAFDSLATLNGAYQQNTPRQWGVTYLDTLAFPVPRALWLGKPLGGGSAWFTSTYFSGYYGPDHVETSVTMLGEAQANFGLIGVLLVPGLLGFGLASLYRRMMVRPTPKAILVYANVLPYAYTFVRGDAYHSIPLALLASGTSLLALAYCSRPVPSAARLRVGGIGVASGS
ncbi:MAG TPA: O-antigen polymerase [Gaiellales bacterium]|nr:O-antigen polymerase [Gaiellales bacterium]